MTNPPGPVPSATPGSKTGFSANELTEVALAKVNLSLRVLGRRPDGYHELESIVAFATTGDRLSLAFGPVFELRIDGPFQAELAGENLVAKAAHIAAEAAGGALQSELQSPSQSGLQSGRVTLTKNLPVAAGLGGGSADGAAMLRLLQRANPALAGKLDWPSLALQLGADVPACLASRAALMTGIGERLAPIAQLPPVAILLVNPRVPLATAAVFRALAAPPIAGDVPSLQPPTYRDFADMIAGLAASSNDLEPAARRLCPPIGDVLASLGRLPGARLVRMSGSGPTCFALFATLAEAEAAARLVGQAQPNWWVAAATLA